MLWLLSVTDLCFEQSERWNILLLFSLLLSYDSSWYHGCVGLIEGTSDFLDMQASQKDGKKFAFIKLYIVERNAKKLNGRCGLWWVKLVKVF